MIKQLSKLNQKKVAIYLFNLFIKSVLYYKTCSSPSNLQFSIRKTCQNEQKNNSNNNISKNMIK